jgi:hypothetical protein
MPLGGNISNNSKFKILTKDLALSRSCGLQPNSAQPLKTTRKCPKSNPVQGEFEGAAPRPLNIGGLGGQPPDPGSHKAIDPEFGIAAISATSMNPLKSLL